jgi:hypothetical protein
MPARLYPATQMKDPALWRQPWLRDFASILGLKGLKGSEHAVTSPSEALPRLTAERWSRFQGLGISAGPVIPLSPVFL